MARGRSCAWEAWRERWPCGVRASLGPPGMISSSLVSTSGRGYPDCNKYTNSLHTVLLHVMHTFFLLNPDQAASCDVPSALLQMESRGNCMLSVICTIKAAAERAFCVKVDSPLGRQAVMEMVTAGAALVLAAAAGWMTSGHASATVVECAPAAAHLRN